MHIFWAKLPPSPIMRRFILGISWRVAVLTALILAASWAAVGEAGTWLGAALIFGLALGMVFNLHYYVTDANRKISRFLESVRYSDFAVRYSTHNLKGETFAELNRQFNEVLEAFRQARAEKEANLQFLHTIVQHLSTGVLAFDQTGNLLLSNTAAFQLLGIYRLRQIADLPDNHRELAQLLRNLKSKGKALYQPEPGRQLAVQGAALVLRGQPVRLVTLQNIFPELQSKELEAWQNLTRVLRHEIMNSVAPIASLIGTMQTIVKEELPRNTDNAAALTDLDEALDLVADRSRGLMNFVDAYRQFSAVPKPKPTEFPVKKLLDKIAQLLGPSLKNAGITLETQLEPDGLMLTADPEQIEMILINLVKNAREAMGTADGTSLKNQNPKLVTIKSGTGETGRVFIEVADTGTGIDAQLMEEIFIPFFTTKESGTGVGLSLSKQIMQLHGGNIRVASMPGEGARFVLEF